MAVIKIPFLNSRSFGDELIMHEKDENMTTETTNDDNRRGRDPGFWRELWYQARLVIRLFRDPEVPIYLKVLPIATVVYAVFPFDFIPDLAIGLGQLDDLTALLVGAKVFIDLSPPHVVARHMAEMKQEDGFRTVEGEAIEVGEPSDKELDASIVIDE